MILGVGCDIVEVSRVVNACEKETFLRKYYTDKERELIGDLKSRAATNFAGKEAVAKAFGTGFAGIRPIDIEILRDDKGAPYVVLWETAQKKAKELGAEKIHISLSDEKMYAMAYVILSDEKEVL